MPTDSRVDSIVSRRVVALALLLGVVGEVLAYDVALGINVPIAIVLTILAMWLVRPRRSRLDVLDGWIVPAAIGFAAAVALRADDALVVLDALAALGLTLMAAVALSGEPVTRRTAARITDIGLRAAVLVLIGSTALLPRLDRPSPSPGPRSGGYRRSSAG
jgi:hypothetical protein